MTSAARHERFPWRLETFDALKIAWGPIATYLTFATVGVVLMMEAESDRLAGYHSTSPEWGAIVLGGALGAAIGFGVSIARVRFLPMALALTVIAAIGGLYAVETRTDNISAPAFTFVFMVPSAYLALRHRFAVASLVGPTATWLAAYHDATSARFRDLTWESASSTAPTWSPVASGSILALYLLTLALYAASMQSMRVALWQRIPEASRLARLGDVGRPKALPHRRELVRVAMVAAFAALTFGGTMFLLAQKDPEPTVTASSSWTEDDDREAEMRRVVAANDASQRIATAASTYVASRTSDRYRSKEQIVGGDFVAPPVDGIFEPGLVGFEVSHRRKYVRRLGQAAPLLDLHDLAIAGAIVLAWAISRRPLKRAFLSLFLRRPWVLVTTSERIENLWESVRIAVEDGGVVPERSESIEHLVARITGSADKCAAVERAGAIYAESRYGFVLAPSALADMKDAARSAVRALEAELSWHRRITRWWRALS